jgi:uncharacterized protein YqeY
MPIGQEFMEDILRDGEIQGEVKASRQAVLEVIKVRFGQVPDPVKTKVNATTDLARLKQWLRFTVEAKDISDIEREIAR